MLDTPPEGTHPSPAASTNTPNPARRSAQSLSPPTTRTWSSLAPHRKPCNHSSPRHSLTSLSSPLPSLIALFVDRFLLELQAAAAVHVSLSGDGTASPEPGASSGPPSLLEFVRVDVDSWIQSNSTSPALTEDTARVRRD